MKTTKFSFFRLVVFAIIAMFATQAFANNAVNVEKGNSNSKIFATAAQPIAATPAILFEATDADLPDLVQFSAKIATDGHRRIFHQEQVSNWIPQGGLQATKDDAAMGFFKFDDVNCINVDMPAQPILPITMCNKMVATNSAVQNDSGGNACYLSRINKGSFSSVQRVVQADSPGFISWCSMQHVMYDSDGDHDGSFGNWQNSTARTMNGDFDDGAMSSNNISGNWT